MTNINILWVDDEIDLLKAHILFLSQKGYQLKTVSNGQDAIDLVQQYNFDLIFLDENMPGLSGLQTLGKIKTLKPDTPVVMITKSEEEDIMDAAIGSKISDYLIKPVNPNQILSSIKKHTDSKRLVNQETTSAYQAEFRNITMQIMQANGFSDWVDIYKKLVYWELEMAENIDKSLHEILLQQKIEANNEFARFITRNYQGWINGQETNRPMLSTNVFKDRVFPLSDEQPVVFILIDNLRYDQWRSMYSVIQEYLQLEHEEIYCSILPTATQYARNAMFAGLMPLEIQKLLPQYWRGEEEEESKNNFELQLLVEQAKRLGKSSSISYQKILNVKTGKRVADNLLDLKKYQINVLVYNFVDMLSHARTDVEMVRELAPDAAAYRSLTISWFKHSYLFDVVQQLANSDFKVVVTTDHGTIQVGNPIKVIGDRNTSVNLRYKTGKNLTYNPKEVFEVTHPEKIHLPKENISSRFIFATNNDYMVFPKNFNQFVGHYKNTFQHGGISLEEMLIPLAILKPKQ
ncbi:MAG: bifunctional response regulator/alkaline phosphatase family protein [Bacteroidales bacterium]|nr:bifunctional response regulator/alkaline phosphatase family protein [Bacteroidales bacterium]